MVECLVALTREGLVLAVVGMIGGVLAGILLMFYRDIVANEHRKRMFWTNVGRDFLLYDKSVYDKQLWLKYETNRTTVSSNEELFFEELFDLKRISSLKAATFSLGMIVLCSTLILVPFGQLGINEVSWIAAGFVTGACFEHSVWLFAQAAFPRVERSTERESTEGESSSWREYNDTSSKELVTALAEVIETAVVTLGRLSRWMASIFGRRTER